MEIGAEDKLNADCFESNEIFPSIRETNPKVEREARPFSERYDFLWFFRTPLATNRGRPITVSTLLDRKSTRLNSSHANISYAVFCLKKKKKKNIVSLLQVITLLHHMQLDV